MGTSSSSSSSIWVLVILSLLHILQPTQGRNPPLLSPSSDHYGTPQPLLPIPSPASPSSSMASPPLVMQMVVVYEHHHMDKELAMAIALSSVAAALVILSFVLACIFWQRNRKDPDPKSGQGSARGVTLGPIMSKFNSLKMTGTKKGSLAMVEYLMLESATSNFSQNNILGEGRSRSVYKACFDGGVLAAVKKLEGCGQDGIREFESEIDLLGKVQHPNVISLLGYCVHEDTRFLVYELMQNGSLETQLHGHSRGAALTWHIRMKIALDIARGLEFLHENCNPPVIHRDLKSSNILLDSEFNAKISDFGLAVTSSNQSKCNVKLYDSLGYVAPEYLLNGKLTEKSDVYAFGVVLLELLIGRKPVEKLSPSECHTIVTWAMPQLTDRSKLPNIVDPVIRNTMDLKHLYQVAAVAVLCVQPEPSYRPLITDVLHSLIPLIPIELGGTLRVSDPSPRGVQRSNPY
ncbi:putative receptor-like protein kinase [Iris pallida]|uniref:Receptor-like protein kinase n=1 Tax=Iris pallida TaxID=29817 RepID=A0AAX6EJB2_IRIPA|nr:putative receptor-like protein kinase [Iris pallida]